MAENQDDGLFREIDEELRQDKAASLAKQYGMYVIGAAVLLVGSVGGYQAWESHTASTRATTTDAFVNAVRLADSSDDGSAAASFDSISISGVDGISAIARMRRASELAEGGDSEAAISAFQGIADDSGIDDDTRALASLNLANLLLNHGDAQGALAAITHLSEAGSDWQYAALEISALAALDQGDVVSARESLSSIALSATAPASLRGRASTLLSTLPEGENE